jgi:DNA-binding NarL/FixJ family response regulator
MGKIKVFLAEPQVLFREGIHFILSGEEDFDVIGETTNNQEALSSIESNPPDVAIISRKDANISGTDITRRLRRNLPSVNVVLIMEKKEPDEIFEAMKSGVSACLDKDSSPEQLLEVIKIVAQGSQPIIEEIFNPAVASLVLNEFADIVAFNEQFDNILANLTPREKHIIELMAGGNNLEQTAVKMDMDEDAVRHCIRIVLTKLIANEQATNIMEVAQRNLNFLLRSGRGEGKSRDYISRAEFNEFKDQLMERFRSFTGDLTPPAKVKK